MGSVTGDSSFVSLGRKKLMNMVFSAGSSTGISDADLKVYWKCNETETPVENKSESSASLSTASNMATTNVTFGETGILDESILFNGSSSYGNVGTSVSQFDFCHVTDHKWSIAFWYKSTNAPSGFETIFATASNSTTADDGFVIALHSSRRFLIDMFDGNTPGPLDDDLTGNDIIPDDDEWHFYVFTFNATLESENLKIFVDGDEDYTANYANSPNTTANASYLMWIGRRTNSSEKFFDGELDEVSIWDKILTSDEIEALYNGGSAQAIYG